MRAILIWLLLAFMVAWPLGVAARSPLLEWRDPVYIAAGFAGVCAMVLMLMQPLLAAGVMPGLPRATGRKVHRWVGAGLCLAVAVHVGGLWLTSPPDVVDVLLFRSPTWFGLWGALALWATVAAAGLALLRPRLRPPLFRLSHTAAALALAVTAALHAVLIDGTMGQVSKVLLCALTVAGVVWAIRSLRSWATLVRARRS